MSGGKSLVKTELARPGVPFTLALESQFWPELVDRFGFATSRELPKPAAALNHDQPEKPSSCTQRQMIFPVAGLAGVPETVILKVLGLTPPTTKRPLYSGWSAPEMIT